MSKTLKSTFLFSGFVLLAQAFGLIRDLFLIRHFGAGPILDTYYLAFKIPDLMNVFYSVFLGSVIFIPLLTKVQNDNGIDGMRKEVSKVGSLVAILVTVIATLLYIGMPILAKVLAPTWGYEQLNLLISISRILLIAQLFFPIGILAGAIGMVWGKPLGMAISGLIYNIFILFGAIFLTPFFGIYGVVYGIIVGAICFALVQIFPDEVRNILFHFKFEFKIDEWVSFIKQNLGRFFTVLINQAFYIVILSIAAAAGQGSVTIFNNAFNIYMAIFFIMGASFSTAIMPHNARLHVEGKVEELKAGLHMSMIYMFSVSIFIALFCFIFSQNIIEIIYYFSKLSEIEILKMSSVFALLSLCIPLLNLSEIARKYMYASNLIKYSVINVGTFLVFLIIFNKLFLTLGFDNLIALALAFFTSNIIALVVTLLFLNYLQRLHVTFILKNIYKTFFVFIFAILIYIFSYPYILDALLSLISYKIISLLIQVLYLFIIYIFLIFLFNDKISKDIWRQVLNFVRNLIS